MGNADGGRRRTGIAHERLSFLKEKYYSDFRFTAYAMFRKIGACCLLMIMGALHVCAQESPKKPMKGVGITLKPGSAYYGDIIIRPIEGAEFHLLGGYGKHNPILANMTKSTVKGWYAGGGLSLVTAPMRRNYNESKWLNGSLRISLSTMVGQVSMNTVKIFPGEKYEDYIFGYSMNREWFTGFEWVFGYELNFDEMIKLGLYPLMVSTGTKLDTEGFELEFLPGLGYTFRVLPGFSLHYIWR